MEKTPSTVQIKLIQEEYMCESQSDSDRLVIMEHFKNPKSLRASVCVSRYIPTVRPTCCLRGGTGLTLTSLYYSMAMCVCRAWFISIQDIPSPMPVGRPLLRDRHDFCWEPTDLHTSTTGAQKNIYIKKMTFF